MRGHEPIERFCDIISALDLSYDAAHVCAIAIGFRPERTGLPETPDRKLRDLYWDVEPSDIRQRLTELVEEHKIDEKVLVVGTMAFLDDYFRRMADAEHSQEALDRNIDMLRDLRNQKQMPQASRRNNISDKNLDNMMATLKGAIENMESNRLQAEQALEALHSAVDRGLDEDFWEAFRDKQTNDFLSGLPGSEP